MLTNKFYKVGNFLARSNWTDDAIDRATDLLGNIADKLGKLLSKFSEPYETDLGMELGGSAEAIGTDTVTTADLKASMVDTEHSKIGVGFAQFTAAASGGASFATTDAYCDISSADFVFTSKTTHSGENWETTTQKVIAIDLDYFEFASPIVIDTDRTWSFDTTCDVVEGNVATAYFDVKLESEDTLSDVWLDALAVENAYSGSSIDATMVIG
ncbi:hypothetical protein OCH239_18770 [Roseivivax halodurans JCM 10272]|uniref:Uncharacterized protein n=1 Tax=Roseivivax halodurans JCM 10272 TaxID=1449350 RepID=X7E9X1_9RHOB|nr:hypothetical protein [Roseivivax halodurans]ETX11996.1 hypothetical protein OCH239_18770 [Roseivivax halodurans JCM 10272]